MERDVTQTELKGCRKILVGVSTKVVPIASIGAVKGDAWSFSCGVRKGSLKFWLLCYIHKRRAWSFGGTERILKPKQISWMSE